MAGTTVGGITVDFLNLKDAEEENLIKASSTFGFGSIRPPKTAEDWNDRVVEPLLDEQQFDNPTWSSTWQAPPLPDLSARTPSYDLEEGTPQVGIQGVSWEPRRTGEFSRLLASPDTALITETQGLTEQVKKAIPSVFEVIPIEEEDTEKPTSASKKETKTLPIKKQQMPGVEELKQFAGSLGELGVHAAKSVYKDMKDFTETGDEGAAVKLILTLMSGGMTRAMVPGAARQGVTELGMAGAKPKYIFTEKDLSDIKWLSQDLQLPRSAVAKEISNITGENIVPSQIDRAMRELGLKKPRTDNKMSNPRLVQDIQEIKPTVEKPTGPTDVLNSPAVEQLIWDYYQSGTSANAIATNLKNGFSMPDLTTQMVNNKINDILSRAPRKAEGGELGVAGGKPPKGPPDIDKLTDEQVAALDKVLMENLEADVAGKAKLSEQMKNVELPNDNISGYKGPKYPGNENEAVNLEELKSLLEPYRENLDKIIRGTFKEVEGGKSIASKMEQEIKSAQDSFATSKQKGKEDPELTRQRGLYYDRLKDALSWQKSIMDVAKNARQAGTSATEAELKTIESLQGGVDFHLQEAAKARAAIQTLENANKGTVGAMKTPLADLHYGKSVENMNVQELVAELDTTSLMLKEKGRYLGKDFKEFSKEQLKTLKIRMESMQNRLAQMRESTGSNTLNAAKTPLEDIHYREPNRPPAERFDSTKSTLQIARGRDNEVELLKGRLGQLNRDLRGKTDDTRYSVYHTERRRIRARLKELE